MEFHINPFHCVSEFWLLLHMTLRIRTREFYTYLLISFLILNFVSGFGYRNTGWYANSMIPRGYPNLATNQPLMARPYSPAYHVPSSNLSSRHQRPLNPHYPRFTGPNLATKRPGSFLSNIGKNKKNKVDRNAVKPVELGGGQSLVIKEEGGELSVSHTRSALSPSPDFFSDPRMDKTAIHLPSTKTFPFFDNLVKSTLSCSFFGNNCTSCNHLNGNHSISKLNVFLIGDQFTPPSIGSQKECVPTIRVNDPSFDTIKETLISQKKNGMGNNGEKVALVCLLSYLIKVGASEYFLQLSNFSEWAKAELSWTIIPFLTPFPVGFPEHALISIQQFRSILQAKFLGDFMGTINENFSMWKPFTDSCTQLNMEKKTLPIPPITIKTTNKTLTIECKSEVFIGSIKNLAVIESHFLPLLFNQLKSVSPPSSSPLTIPGSDALRAGLCDGSVSLSTRKPKLFLMGSSILKNCVETITESAKTSGFDVVSLCKGGDFFKNIKSINLPESDNNKDTLVLLFLGNNIFNKSNFFIANGVWHMDNPKLLNDKEINDLILAIRNIFIKLRLSFKGKIKLFGPLPRFTKPCCPKPHHNIPISFPFTSSTDYILFLNKFLALHPFLRSHNIEFIPPNSIFGPSLPTFFTTDLVHLTPSASNTLSSFIKNIIIKKSVVRPTLDLEQASSFYRWASEIKRVPPTLSAALSATPHVKSLRHLVTQSDQPTPSILDDQDPDEEDISDEADIASALALLDMSFD